MNWNKSGFSRHYKKVIVEGNDPERLINICIQNGIQAKEVRVISETSMYLQLNDTDYSMLEELAGNRYRIKIIAEGGYAHSIREILKRKALIAGLLIFAGILIYQSLFVSEIEVCGYESISESDLRKSMKEAGFYEGCRKNVSLDKVKLHLYDDFDNISWIGIKYEGNLAQVTIAETDFLYQKYNIRENTPCNIVADKNGYVNKVDPECGVRAVEKGDFVKAGDVLISGKVPLEKTTYEEGSENDTETYVHAAGTVDAKVPVRLNFYETLYEYKRKPTGRKTVSISLNNHDLLNAICPYKTAVVHHVNIINIVKPVRIKLQLNIAEEVTLKRYRKDEKNVRKQVLNEIQEYVREKLPDNTQILNKSLNFVQEKNIIRVGVTLETLQQIGIEEEIIVDKSNRQSD